MLIVPPVIYRPRKRAVITYIGGTTITTDTTTFTFTDHAVGTASQDRVVLVSASLPITSSGTATATFGAVAATELVTALAGTATPRVSLFGLLVPTGTTSTIVITTSHTSNACRVGVWSMVGTGGRTTTYATATDTAGGNVMTSTINVPLNGATVGAAFFIDTTAGLTGSTAVGVTEDYDTTVETANRLATGGSSSDMAAETGRTVSFTSNLDADVGSSAVWASFAPQ